MQGIPEYVTCGSDGVMVSDDLYRKVRVFSKSTFPAVIVVEVHAVWLPEAVHESVRIRRLYQLVGVGGHE